MDRANNGEVVSAWGKGKGSIRSKTGMMLNVIGVIIKSSTFSLGSSTGNNTSHRSVAI